MKNRPCGGINMMAALLAGERAPLRHRVKLGALHPTSRTRDLGAAEIDFHQLPQARGVIWILGLELFEGVFGHGALLYTLSFRPPAFGAGGAASGCNRGTHESSRSIA